MEFKSTESKQIGKEPVEGFALGKINYLLIIAAFVMIVLGLALMAGSGSTMESYNPEIFSWRRIVLAPSIAFIGFVFMVFAIMYNGKKLKKGKEGTV